MNLIMIIKLSYNSINFPTSSQLSHVETHLSMYHCDCHAILGLLSVSQHVHCLCTVNPNTSHKLADERRVTLC